MKIDVPAVRKCLKAFDFKTLFREHLGWDNHQAQLDISVGGNTFTLEAVAQKRSFVAFVFPSIPDRPTRLKIDHQITKSAREHFVIYCDQAAGQQVWQWVRRDQDKPLASRDHRFDASQSGDSLIQRLDRIAVSLDEEEDVTIVDVAGRARAAFDVDKVTKKFYDRFKTEHTAFLKLIKGIKADADLQWYTSLMLNRLMFVYFIQKKGFLDGDLDYLRSRLAVVRQAKGKDKFHSFYRYFLLRLFHDGLGKSPDERKLDKAMEKLLGKVPYLNGGFFEVHQLEEHNPDIDIPDKAFEKLFDFFDQYSWHLDERPLRTDNEINPDVVGYIFEKYINQKQMGAYYTKEDITEYISKNTIIPFLFDAAQKKCAIAFKPDSALWRLLRDDPDRYIYPAVRQGVVDEKGNVVPLPKDIEAGVKDVAKRNGWNRAATDPYALPAETWREHVARRQRCLDVREKLCEGEVHQINDLITLNLDIWQFARDAIVNAEGPELLRAFWHAIEKVTVLDPTCGSGAFLFAALRILETLYSDCLERMGRFIEDAEHTMPVSSEKQVRALIAAGESTTLEYKSSARWDIKESKYNPLMEEMIVKTVAGFLNGYGGTLLIGVDDFGNVLGLEKDYQHTKKQNPCRDQFELWLNRHLMNKLGKHTKPCFHLDFACLDGLDVCRLIVYRSSKPVFIEKNGHEVLYARQGNATNPHTQASDILVYTQQHWPADQPVPAPPPPTLASPAAKPSSKTKRTYDDFRAVLAALGEHSSHAYFILKSIIINNLFGVDIMAEAVEICRLRLFLKLVAQVETVGQIEPLPDIDFNIRAGNTLVGYTTLDQVRKSQEGTLGFGKDQIERIEEDAEMVERAFRQFRAQQTTHGGRATHKDKQDLRNRLDQLDDELDLYLAGEYGVNVERQKAFDAWKTSHEPFHWFVEFYGIMNAGGFDVIIGNPPYVSAAKVRKVYTVRAYGTDTCTDIYAWCLERVSQLAGPNALTGMIVPLSLTFSGSFASLRSLLYAAYGANWFSSFGRIPAALFAHDVRVRNTIHLGAKRGMGTHFATRLHRWFDVERENLLSLMSYAQFDPARWSGRIPKLNTQALVNAFESASARKKCLGFSLSNRPSKYRLYFKKTAYNWLNFCRKMPPCYDENGKSIPHTQFDDLFTPTKQEEVVTYLLLNGKLQLSFWLAIGDDFHVTKWMCADLPVDVEVVSAKDHEKLSDLAQQLSSAMKNATTFKLNAGKRVGNYNLARCRRITDESDLILARAFGFHEVWSDIELLYRQCVRTDFGDEEGDNE